MKLTVLKDNNKAVVNNLVDLTAGVNSGSFLFVSPHDDDALLGGGLMMKAAVDAGIDVHLVVVTDGSMGYCSEEERISIADIRKAETIEGYAALGLKKENIHMLGFKDCQLSLWAGKREAKEGDSCVIGGYTGIQNAMTYYIRKIQPTACFVPTFNDLHPDHKIVYTELLISLFHAQGEIWPELGEPIKEVPSVFEMAVYCDFPEVPNVELLGEQADLDVKTSAIGKFVSQKQISALIKKVEQGGAVEYFRELEFKFYDPSKYRSIFG